MPLESCTIAGKPGKRFGPTGRCYTGSDAEKKALRQGRAIEASKARKRKALNRKKGVYNERTVVLGCSSGSPSMWPRYSRSGSFGGNSLYKKLPEAVANKRKGVYNEQVVLLLGNHSDSLSFDSLRESVCSASLIVNQSEQVRHRPLAIDPTRTATLRRKFVEEFNRRFERLKRAILELVVKDDAFGLIQNKEQDNAGPGNGGETARVRDSNRGYSRGYPHSQVPITGDQGSPRALETLSNRIEVEGRVRNQRFAFPRTSQQVDAFGRWLESQVQATVVVVASIEEAENAYWRRFVQEGYEKGAGRAFDQVRKPALAFEPGGGVSDFFRGTREEFLRSAFARPIAIERVKELAGRVFHGPPGEGLKDVTRQMDVKMREVLTRGLSEGKNPREIGRLLARQVALAKKRAEKIARTEVIRAHAEGQLDSMERLGVQEVGVMVEWSTAGDARVCPMCQPLEGSVMKILEARGTLPRHPNCRCAFIPANVGEDKAKKREVKFRDPNTGEVESKEIPRKRTAKTLRQARDKSVRAEFRDRKKPETLRKLRAKSRWTGADKRFAKERPKSILDKADKQKTLVDSWVKRYDDILFKEGATFAEIDKFLGDMAKLPANVQKEVFLQEWGTREGQAYKFKLKSGAEARKFMGESMRTTLERRERAESIGGGVIVPIKPKRAAFKPLEKGPTVKPGPKAPVAPIPKGKRKPFVQEPLKPTAGTKRWVEVIESHTKDLGTLDFADIDRLVERMSKLPADTQRQIFLQHYRKRTGETYRFKVASGKQAREEIREYLTGRLEKFQRTQFGPKVAPVIKPKPKAKLKPKPKAKALPPEERLLSGLSTEERTVLEIADRAEMKLSEARAQLFKLSKKGEAIKTKAGWKLVKPLKGVKPEITTPGRTIPRRKAIPKSIGDQGSRLKARVARDKEMFQTLDDYTNVGHAELNQKLRTRATLSTQQKRQLPILDSITEQPVNVTTYRGVGPSGQEFLEKARKSLRDKSFLQDRAYVSTSPLPEVAAEFSQIQPRPVVLQIKAKRGGYLEKAMETDEFELLLPRGSRFRVLEIEENVTILTEGVPFKKKFTVIRLEQI